MHIKFEVQLVKIMLENKPKGFSIVYFDIKMKETSNDIFHHKIIGIYIYIFGCAGSSSLPGLFSSCGEWGLGSA